MILRIRNFLRPREPKAIVLMYHRVCNLETDPWQLAVSPNNFETQIKELKKNFNVLPLSDLVEQFSIGKIEPNSVYITFDDAYRDNYLNAKPMLEKYNCPATFFIPTHFVGKQQLFWWDELEIIFLHSITLPTNLTLTIDENSYTFHFGDEQLTEEVRLKQQSWIWPNPTLANRCKIYLELYELLKPLAYSELFEIMDFVRKWADFTPSYWSENYPMNNEELENLANNELFSLGIHTMTHPALACHSAEIQSSEIAGSKDYLIGKGYPQINAIAYPYGNYNNETLSIVAQNSIPLGFTTLGEVITQHSSPLHLGRFQVTNCSGTVLMEKLRRYFD